MTKLIMAKLLFYRCFEYNFVIAINLFCNEEGHNILDELKVMPSLAVYFGENIIELVTFTVNEILKDNYTLQSDKIVTVAIFLP